MICLHIASLKSDIIHLGCVDISYSVDLLKIHILY